MNKFAFSAFTAAVAVLVPLLTDQASAKRAAPPVVKPVSCSGITYNADYSKDPATFFIASIVATNAKSKKQLWKTEIYQVKYDTTLERDVQEFFVKSLVVKGKKLIAVDENGKQYSIDARTGRKLDK